MGVKASLHSTNQKNKKSEDLGQIWDFTEKAKKGKKGVFSPYFSLKVKPHKMPQN